MKGERRKEEPQDERKTKKKMSEVDKTAQFCVERHTNTNTYFCIASTTTYTYVGRTFEVDFKEALLSKRMIGFYFKATYYRFCTATS